MVENVKTSNKIGIIRVVNSSISFFFRLVFFLSWCLFPMISWRTRLTKEPGKIKSGKGKAGESRGDKAIMKGNGKLTANNRPIVNSDSREKGTMGGGWDERGWEN